MIFTLSGPSGVGKDTIVDFLFTILPNAGFLPSYTTRAHRDTDRGYIYVSDEKFSDLKEKRLLAWDVEIFGNRYGTRISDIVTASLDNEKIWIGVVTPDRVPSVHSWSKKLGAGRVASVYLYCREEDVLRERLINRGDKDIDKRIRGCRGWGDIALQYHNLFLWINGGGELEWTKRTVANTLKQVGFVDLKA